jgi:AcrR family transcriptional regulator
LSPTPPPTSDAAGRQRSARQTRDRLARAALELFTARGFHGTTTPLIAARAGVAEGTIYRHFPSKEDLLNEVFRAAVRALAEAFRSADPAWPCRARLDHVADRWVATAKRDPTLVRLVFSHAFADVLDERSRTVLRELHGLIEQTVAAGKSAGSVRRGAADLWADVWLELIVLVLGRVAAGTWQPGDAATTQVRQAAWDAIRAETVPPAPEGATIPDPATGERS